MTKIRVRHTKIGDVDELVRIEMDRYADLYSSNKKDAQQVRDLFLTRLGHAPTWMWTCLLDGRVAGFLSAMPTKKSVQDFVSWEETTNNGTLDGTIDQGGKNLYVVNLDIARGSGKHNAQYALMATLASTAIRTNMNMVFFESRLPMFRDWVRATYGLTAFSALSEADKLTIAAQYTHLTKSAKGKMIPHDRLLAFYTASGFRFDRVLAQAFKDPESLDFGVVCYAVNPLPGLLRRSPWRQLVGRVLLLGGRYPAMLDRFIR
jgi:hypothetical protein